MEKSPMLRSSRLPLMLILLVVAAFVGACNLTASPGGVEELTQEVTPGALATRTPAGTLNSPTRLPLTSLAPTQRPGQFPTSVVSFPTAVVPPSQPNPQIPVSIVILSPIPGNVIAGNVQVLGSAQHPQFLQYQLEYGPDPNPNNLWYAATGPISQSVTNNLLGIWNTNAVQDGVYQLRLRVFLRDATSLSTVVNNLRIQNQAPTQVPSATPNTARPIAAFTLDKNQGQAPLPVRFVNQSNGSINAYQWNFGDGSTSSDPNPQHNFSTPGLYNVTLTVSGPGGSSNVSTQISVQSPNAPNAGFTADKFSGPAPLTVQFQDTTSGNVTSYHWNFSDGTGSTDRNPRHVFNTPGTYNVFLTVIGPGGSTSTRREVTVNGPTQTPPPTLAATVVVPPSATPVPTETSAPTQATLPVANFSQAPAGDMAIQFTDSSTSSSGGITGWMWDFGDGATSTEQNPTHTYGAAATYNVTLTVTDAAGSNSAAQTVSIAAPMQPPVANFSTTPAGDLTIQALDASTSSSGGITAWLWSFGDGATSTEQNPTHTYAAANSYTIELTVTDAGGTNTTSQTINVAAPAQPAVANFSAAPAGDLAIQFTDTSTSSTGITSWQWDFGDGNTSTDQNPLHTYAAPGDYNVTLTVTDSVGSQPASQTVNVAAPQAPPAQPGLQDTTNILPDFGDNDLRNNISSIVQNGQGLGNRAGVFTVAGDESARAGAYLDPFNNPSDYALDDSTNGLQVAIDFFKATDLGGVSSFNLNSLATGDGWKIGDLLNADRADGSRCNPGETPLACELRNTQPSVVIISIGMNDVTQNTDINEFRSQLQQVVSTATGAGVVPVLTTLPPRPDQADRVREFNDAIIQIGDDANVPVYNLWRALSSLPNSGLNGDNASLSQAPGVPGDITSGATANGGVNTRNRDVLTLLNSLRDEFLD
jgi:PKD repeat protein